MMFIGIFKINILRKTSKNPRHFFVSGITFFKEDFLDSLFYIGYTIQHYFIYF